MAACSDTESYKHEDVRRDKCKMMFSKSHTGVYVGIILVCVVIIKNN